MRVGPRRGLVLGVCWPKMVIERLYLVGPPDKHAVQTRWFQQATQITSLSEWAWVVRHAMQSFGPTFKSVGGWRLVTLVWYTDARIVVARERTYTKDELFLWGKCKWYAV